MNKSDPDGVVGGGEQPVLRPGQVVERVIERRADPQTGMVTERIVQTVAAPGGVPPTMAPTAITPPVVTQPVPAVSGPVAAAAVDPEAPHAPTSDQDEVYYEGSPMLRGELGRVLLWGSIGVALIMAPFLIGRVMHGTPTWWRWWLTAAFVVAGVVVLIVPLVLTRSVRYRVTNYRINWERGLFAKTIDTLELWHVEDLKFRQGMFQRLMGVGTIYVLSHDKQAPNLVLDSVPSARQLYETLQQRVIAVKRSAGVMKVDTGV